MDWLINIALIASPQSCILFIFFIYIQSLSPMMTLHGNPMGIQSIFQKQSQGTEQSNKTSKGKRFTLGHPYTEISVPWMPHLQHSYYSLAPSQTTMKESQAMREAPMLNSALYWVRPLASWAKYYLLWLAASFQGLEQKFFKSPTSCSFQFEVPGIKGGILCM